MADLHLGSAVHIAIDMQRLFGEPESPWNVPWLSRVLPQVLELARHHPERTVFTRFIPPQQQVSIVTLDGSRASVRPDVVSRPPESASLYIPPGEPFRLRVFVDRSVVEVFVNGRHCLAMRVCPSRDDSLGVSLRSQGQDAELKSLDVWEMQSIYR